MNWNKVFKVLGIGLLLMVAVIVGGGLVLNDSVDLETEAVLDAPPVVVHALIADPAGVKRWWTDAAQTLGNDAMDGMTIERGDGPTSGPGARVLFRINGTLAEEWTLVSATPPTQAVWDVDFQLFVVRRTLTLSPEGPNRTKVKWRDAGKFENPVVRWFTLMPADSVIQNFNNALGLMNKKAIVDAKTMTTTTATTTGRAAQ